MPLGEWLNSVILQQAEQDGTQPHYDSDDEESYGDEISSVHQRLDDITRKIEQFASTAQAPKAAPKPKRSEPARETDQLAQLISRLDQRLDQFANIPRMMAAQSPPIAPPIAPPMAHMPPAANLRAAYPPMHPQAPLAPPMYPPIGAPQFAPAPAPKGATHFAPPAARAMAPQAQPDMQRAVAEIALRMKSLSGGQNSPAPSRPAPLTPADYPPQVQAYAPPQAQYAPMLTPVPSQDLSGLEEHLRQITDQIETLRRPGVEDAINALRGELGDIGRALNDAMPRHAIDAIEKQIQGLTQRIAENRQSGGADGRALSGVEHALAEVRDALRGLTPAENLVGFNEAVSGLAHKIDLIVAQKNPETIGQLEHAITTLRDMAEHVASNEAVSHLAGQVQRLSEKVDEFGRGGGGASDALNSLEHRIGALSDALAQRSQQGVTVPPRLEALVLSLSDKIEQIQQSRGDNVAAGHLEDQIVALVQRLDASDSRLGHLEAIERGLADLLVHIEEIRATKGGSGPRETSQGVIDLKEDIARTQNALDAVHGTLGLVVDRLATIERDVRSSSQGQARAAAPLDLEMMEIAQPIGKIAARAVEIPQPAPAPLPAAPTLPPAAQLQPVAPQAQPQQASPQQTVPQQAPRPQQPPKAMPLPQEAPPPPQAKRPPSAPRRPINPDLPPDQPIEPGSASRRFQPNPAARIAASEAALIGARDEPVAGPTGKSGFIAAARRAAQAAIETATPRGKAKAVPRPEPRPEPVADPIDEIDDRAAPTARQSIMKRVKSLLIAASIVAIVIGSIQIASNIFNFGGPSVPQRQNALGNGAAPTAQSAPDDETSQNANPNPPAGSNKDGGAPDPSLLSGNSMTAPNGGPGIAPSPPPPATMPSLLNPPAINTAPGARPLNPSALESTGDVTGSIPRPAAKPVQPTKPPVIPEADRLPIAIGSAKLRSAAAGGDAAAAYEVAQRFAEGRGISPDPEEAARWYERAAGKGLAVAQFRFASLLEKGQGVRKNLGQARKLYLAAATQGHAKAMHNLAVLYAEGIDGKPDYSTAATWFRKAAKHGVADSQYNLGVLCARGLGTDKSMAEAYQWFSLAAAQGDHEAAKKRDDVAAHMDADELETAREAVKNFVAEPQPHSAITVPVPQGGWDDATGAAPPPRPAKPHAARALSANMPLQIGTAQR